MDDLTRNDGGTSTGHTDDVNNRKSSNDENDVGDEKDSGRYMNKNDNPPPVGEEDSRALAWRLYGNAEILAPMVRASTTALRTLALQYGADLVYSEELVDRSVLQCRREETQLPLPNGASKTVVDYVKDLPAGAPTSKKKKANESRQPPVLLRIDPPLERDKLIFQVGTGNGALALQACQVVLPDVAGVDVNMGCPKKFSTHGGMGSALLSDPERAVDICRTLRRNLPASKTVSAKIRLLPTVSQTVDFCQALAQHVDALTIHGRQVGDESQTSARLEMLQEVCTALKSTALFDIPLVINGDLYTREAMATQKARCQADAVMLARPALYNVSLFSRSGLLDKTTVVQNYMERVVEYQANVKNAKYVICEMLTNRRAPSSWVPFLPQKYPGGQSIDLVCRCKTLNDLCLLWNVQWQPLPPTAAAPAGITTSKPPALPQEQQAPQLGEHMYDDAYFLDPQNYARQRRRKQMEQLQTNDKDEEKKEASYVEETTALTTAEKEEACGNHNKRFRAE